MKNSKQLIIKERKSSNFGQVTMIDTQDSHSLGRASIVFNHGYYDDYKREDVYKVCRSKYLYDQLARPVINLIVNAIFHAPPDFQGDPELVKAAEKIVQKNEIDWHSWGVDLEIMGDIFLRYFGDSAPTIASIPAETVTIDYNPVNSLQINNFVQYINQPNQVEIPEWEVVHGKINAPSSVIYGTSTLRPILWWLDVLDTLFEQNWIRSAQYYGAPVIVIQGVPGEHQDKIRQAIEDKKWRPGRTLILPEGATAIELDFSKTFAIQEIVDRCLQYILSACNVPQHLIYESDSSRGVAMFSGDGFEWMIKNRQQKWGNILYRLFRRIFERKGIWTADSEFKIGWVPVFQRDMKDLAKVIESLRTDGTISKRTAREAFGIDHSQEVERLKDAKTEEPEPVLPAIPGALPAKPAAKPAGKVPSPSGS